MSEAFQAIRHQCQCWVWATKGHCAFCHTDSSTRSRAAHTPASFSERRSQGRAISGAGSGASRHHDGWGAGDTTTDAPGRGAPSTRSRSTSCGRVDVPAVARTLTGCRASTARRAAERSPLAARGCPARSARRGVATSGLRGAAFRATEALGCWGGTGGGMLPGVTPVMCACSGGGWLGRGGCTSAAGETAGAATTWSLGGGGLLGRRDSRPACHNAGALHRRPTRRPTPTPQAKRWGHRRWSGRWVRAAGWRWVRGIRMRGNVHEGQRAWRWCQNAVPSRSGCWRLRSSSVGACGDACWVR
jgi:hypothetical protein